MSYIIFFLGGGQMSMLVICLGDFCPVMPFFMGLKTKLDFKMFKYLAQRVQAFHNVSDITVTRCQKGTITYLLYPMQKWIWRSWIRESIWHATKAASHISWNSLSVLGLHFVMCLHLIVKLTELVCLSILNYFRRRPKIEDKISRIRDRNSWISSAIGCCFCVTFTTLMGNVADYFSW